MRSQQHRVRGSAPTKGGRWGDENHSGPKGSFGDTELRGGMDIPRSLGSGVGASKVGVEHHPQRIWGPDGQWSAGAEGWSSRGQTSAVHVASWPCPPPLWDTNWRNRAASCPALPHVCPHTVHPIPRPPRGVRTSNTPVPPGPTLQLLGVLIPAACSGQGAREAGDRWQVLEGEGRWQGCVEQSGCSWRVTLGYSGALLVGRWAPTGRGLGPHGWVLPSALLDWGAVH